jgi:hypothetical protein
VEDLFTKLHGVGRDGTYVRRVLELKTLVALFVAFVTGGYGVGTFMGKVGAVLVKADRSYWGDVGGIVGGLIGLGLYLGVVVGMVTS